MGHLFLHPVWRAALLLALLFGEISLFHSAFPDVRIFIFDSLGGFRAIKVLIAVAGFLAVSSAVRRTKLPLDGRPEKFLAIHLALFVVLYCGVVDLLWRLTLSGSPLAVAGWLLMALCYCSSWLFCLCRPKSLAEYVAIDWMPLGFLVLGLTPLINFAESLWKGRFVQLTFDCCSWLGGFFFHEIVQDPERLVFGVPEFQVTVGHLCSGYEGMGLISAFLAVYLWLQRDVLRFPAACCLLPIGIVASWMANVVRIVVLVAIGARHDPELAIGAFHSQAGWVAFLGLAIVMVLVTEHFKFFRHQSSVLDSDLPAVPFLMPLIVQLALALLFSTFSSGLDFFYPARTLMVGAVIVFYLPSLRACGVFSAPGFNALSVGVLVYVMWIQLVPEVGVSMSLEAPAHLAGLWLVFRLLGSILVVPIVEELAFRGYLLRRLQGPLFEDVPIGQTSLWSVTVSSLLFGLLHTQFVAGVFASVAYSFAANQAGKLGDAIAAHAVTNLCIAAHVVIFNRWDLWI